MTVHTAVVLCIYTNIYNICCIYKLIAYRGVLHMKSRDGVEFFPITTADSGYETVEGEIRIPLHMESDSTPYFAGFTLYKEGYVRYRIEPSETTRWKFPFADLKECNLSKTALRETDDAYILSSEELAIHVQKAPYAIKIVDKEGSVLVEEFPNDVNARSEWISPPTGTLINERKETSTRINISNTGSTHYFGTGERFGTLQQNNRRFTLWNDNPYGSGTERSYKNIPLVVTDCGYGLLLHETAPSTWDFGKTSNFSFSIETEQEGIDLIIILGSSIPAILTKYAALTSVAPMPPRWTFGVWVSPFGNYLDAGSTWQQKEILSFIDSINEKRMPCDVIHLDPYWMGKTKKLCDFTWDTTDYPDPKGFIEDLKKRDLKLCLWEHPYIEKGSDLYNEGAEKGYFIKNRDGSVYDYNIVIVPAERRKAEQKEYAEDFYALGSAVDFSNAEAVEWYKSLHRPLIEMGTATFKTDFGEVTPYDARYHNGKTGKEMHNIYSYLYNKTVWEVQKEYTEMPFLWGRSGYAGSQAFPVQWSGDPVSDMRSLRTTITSGLNFGLSGIPFWSFDIGGFKGLPDAITYVRWAQVGLLVSHSRFHGTASRMPWDFGDEAESIVMEAVRLRYRLLPYLYATAKIASETLIPVIRALPLMYEHDMGALSSETEFMLGDSLLVVPVLDESGNTQVYLPPGNWYDFKDGTLHVGPLSYKQHCDLDTLPIFVRQGAIIPMTKDTMRVQSWDDELIIHIYGKTDNQIVVPEEVTGIDTTVKTCLEKDGLSVKIDAPKRNWQLVLHDWKTEPKSVALDESPMQKKHYKFEGSTLTIFLKSVDRTTLCIKEG